MLTLKNLLLLSSLTRCSLIRTQSLFELPTTTFIDQLDSDTGLTKQDLVSACHDQQTEMEQTYKIGAGAPEIDSLR